MTGKFTVDFYTVDILYIRVLHLYLKIGLFTKNLKGEREIGLFITLVHKVL